MEKQRTLASSATLTGGALHTGENVTLTILPAPPDHGFKFQRTDLPDEPLVDAAAAHVKTVERATTLVQGSVKIHTVEHVLSALTGLGVDNALVQMNANEPPIGDGSASAYVRMIEDAGIVEQEAPRRFLEIKEPLCVELNGSSLVILPDSSFRVSCTQVGPEGRFTQYLSTEITPDTYKQGIATARTFVFYEDVKPLMDKGLIKGGSLENAIVARGESVLSKEPLRFSDEFVRHKILDIVGDLALCGRRIKGHVIAVKPGHGINTEAARQLAQRIPPRPPPPVPMPPPPVRSTSTRSCKSYPTATRFSWWTGSSRSTATSRPPASRRSRSTNRSSKAISHRTP